MRFRAGVELDLARYSVPIAADDGQIRDQVMQIGFVHHDDAGMFQRHFIDECVMRIIAELIDRKRRNATRRSATAAA